MEPAYIIQYLYIEKVTNYVLEVTQAWTGPIWITEPSAIATKREKNLAYKMLYNKSLHFKTIFTWYQLFGDQLSLRHKIGTSLFLAQSHLEPRLGSRLYVDSNGGLLYPFKRINRGELGAHCRLVDHLKTFAKTLQSRAPDHLRSSPSGFRWFGVDVWPI